MCGLSGIINLTATPAAFNPQIIKRMLNAIQHRGPDARSSKSFKEGFIAHNRLKIVDLSDKANQPLCNEKQTVWLAFNGEIYNEHDLKKKYLPKNRGHFFSSKTDCEVIIHLYEEFGISFIPSLIGIYSFVIWDTKAKKVFLARDHLGVKPFFYAKKNNKFIFSSEIKAILEADPTLRVPSEEALWHYFSLGYSVGAQTAFKEIKELSPGSIISINLNNGAIEESNYFKYTLQSSNIKLNVAKKTTQTLFEKSIRRQMNSDVPIGVMLSGGLDSYAIAWQMKKLMGKEHLHTFSLKFKEFDFDESGHSRELAKQLGTIHHEIEISPGEILDIIPKCTAHMDEPFCDPSAWPIYMLAQKASKLVKVLISGDGGDEFFAGYSTLKAWKLRNIYHLLPKAIRLNFVRKFINFLPPTYNKTSFEYLAKLFVNGAELDLPQAYSYWREMIPQETKSKLLRFSSSHFLPTHSLFEEKIQQLNNNDEINQLLFLDGTFHFVDKIQSKTDRMTMAHSIEARVPLADIELVKFLASLPGDYKYRKGVSKFLLKKITSDAPQWLIKKKKKGLFVPHSHWLRHELANWGETLINNASPEIKNFLDMNMVGKLWEEHQGNIRDHGNSLLTILNFLQWFKMFIEKQNNLYFSSSI